ncbi:MAG: glutamine--fructose-6-phosphate aminotransferase, partial [Firmicutes bacterium]|nr:glutamine--fructose-6-phosphate aminotransferase [Bacillota bacterium]
MCGIVGYVGTGNAKDVIIDGLKKLEYRGYDSAGIAVVIDKKIEIKKHVGGIENLENLIGDDPLCSHTGIGHTRWATHGAPSDVNAHPHASGDSSVAVVHNGIIENYAELKEELISQHGVIFRSET